MKKSLPTTTLVAAIPPAPAIRLLHTGLFILSVFLGLAMVTSDAVAKKTPDGKTPAEEIVCDGLEGSEFGICNAYCEATDCGDGINYAKARACESLLNKWTKQTGLDQLPCDCEAGEAFNDETGCECAADLVVRIIDFRSLGCPTGQGSCDHEADIEVENLGSKDIVDPFDVLVTLPGVGLGNTESFPAGLPAGVTEQRMGVFLGTGDNCFDPDCEVEVEADIGNLIEECDESNNTAFELFLG